MRARVRYAKTGRPRFVSAIDLGRIWERALRRADLPIAYSEGFTPHPKISFPDALPLGYASVAEYAELAFAGPFPLPPAIRRLNDAFPDGIEVLDAHEVPEGAPKLAKRLRASVWDLAYPPGCALALAEAAEALRDADELPVDRERKGEVTRLDLRPALAQISAEGSQHAAPPTVRVTIHHVEPPMRPSEVHQALDHASRARASMPLPDPLLITRIAQGVLEGGVLCEALTGEVVSPHPQKTPEKAINRD